MVIAPVPLRVHKPVPHLYLKRGDQIIMLKIRTDSAKKGESYHELLLKGGFHPTRYGVPSPVGRVMKGSIAMIKKGGKRAYWLLGKLYEKKD